jgi:hypothetical protein
MFRCQLNLWTSSFFVGFSNFAKDWCSWCNNRSHLIGTCQCSTSEDRSRKTTSSIRREWPIVWSCWWELKCIWDSRWIGFCLLFTIIVVIHDDFGLKYWQIKRWIKSELLLLHWSAFIRQHFTFLNVFQRTSLQTVFKLLWKRISPFLSVYLDWLISDDKLVQFQLAECIKVIRYLLLPGNVLDSFQTLYQLVCKK